MHVLQNHERLLDNDRVIVGMTLVLLAAFGVGIVASLFPSVTVGVIGDAVYALSGSEALGAATTIGSSTITAAAIPYMGYSGLAILTPVLGGIFFAVGAGL